MCRGPRAVGQELVGLLVVQLHGGLLDELTLFIEAAEEVGSGAAMLLGGGTAVYIERYAQLLETVLDYIVVTVHYVLRSDTLVLGLYSDGHAVLVATAYEENLPPLQAQVSDINVRRDIDSRQMAYVDRAIGIRQSRSHQRTLEFFIHSLKLYFTVC